MTNTEKLAALPKPPEGSRFRLSKIEYVNHKPHPYVIGSRHVAYAADHCGGMLGEDAITAAERNGIHCAHSGCRVSYENHTSDTVCFVAIDPQYKTPGEVPGLQEFLGSLKTEAEHLEIDGFAFVKDEEPEGYEAGRIAKEGMGGFLCPPTHPEHDWHVETDLTRPKHDRGGMSLSSATTCEWLKRSTREAAKAKLAEWERPALESVEIQDWIHQVLGYFRNCYRNPAAPGSEQWHAGKMRIPDPAWNPLEHIDEHAGVHHVREYYPEFMPSAEHFGAAYWGKKRA